MMDARSRARLAIARRATNALRHRDFRGSLAECPDCVSRPVIAALPNDRMSDVFRQLVRYDCSATLVTEAADGGMASLPSTRPRRVLQPTTRRTVSHAPEQMTARSTRTRRSACCSSTWISTPTSGAGSSSQDVTCSWSTAARTTTLAVLVAPRSVGPFFRLTVSCPARTLGPSHASGPVTGTGPDLRVCWWRGRDLNPRPSGYEPDELPDCSTPRRWELTP